VRAERGSDLTIRLSFLLSTEKVKAGHGQ